MQRRADEKNLLSGDQETTNETEKDILPLDRQSK